MDIIKVGKTIAYFRKQAGYTQKELADRIGISDKAVSKWERGQGLPEVSYLRKLSILLDTDLDSLLAGNLAHHNNDWQGILVLEENANGIGAGTVIYDKPLVYFQLSYFLLLGIRKIHVVCGEADREAVGRILGDGSAYGFQIVCHGSLASVDYAETPNLMVVHGRFILYGVDQTRFFLRAMADKTRLTVLALPKKSEALHMDLEKRVLEAGRPEKLSTQYDYSRIPVFFMPSEMFPEMAAAEDLSSFIGGHEAFVEMLDRGFVEIEVDDWNDVQDASVFLRIVQEKCGMNVYCLEEVAWRRGFISLEQMEAFGTRKKDTEYGAYILSLCQRMKGK